MQSRVDQCLVPLLPLLDLREDAVHPALNDETGIDPPPSVTPVAALAVTAADVVLGPAAPVTDITDDTATQIASIVDATIEGMPAETLQTMGAEVESAMTTAFDDAIDPTNAQVAEVVIPVVKRHANLSINPIKKLSDLTVLGLSWEERTVCALMPYQCIKAYGTDKKAHNETVRRYKGSWVNDPSDAFRHCFWSALMTKSSGEKFAQRFTNAHEQWNIRQGQGLRETQMDLHNNAQGFASGRDRARERTLSARCYGKQLDRVLDWFAPSPTS